MTARSSDDRWPQRRGEVFEKYGCALYTVAALAALFDDDDRIYPAVHVRREDEGPKDLLSAFPNVDLTGVRSASGHGAVVELTYVDQNTRIKKQTGFMAPITPTDVEFALHADAFVCVPITDYEVGPTSTLVIGGERRRRLWVERDSWLPHVDILKMNVEEAGCSWFPAQITLGHQDAGTHFRRRSCRSSPSTACVTACRRSASRSTRAAAWRTGWTRPAASSSGSFRGSRSSTWWTRPEHLRERAAVCCRRAPRGSGPRT